MEQQESITQKGLHAQFNKVGFSCILFVLLGAGLTFAYEYGLDHFGYKLQGYNLVSINLALEIIGKILVWTIPFAIGRNMLKVPFREIFQKTGMKLSTLVGFASGGVAIYLFLSFIFSSITYFTNPEALTAATVHPALLSHDPFLIITYVIYFAILAPFVEEYAFRGVVCRAFGKIGGVFAIIASSLLYTILLAGFDNVVITFVFSMYLALQSLIYHSIWPSFFTQVLVRFVLLSGIIIPAQYGWFFGVISVVIYAISIFSLFKSRGKKLIWNSSVPSSIAWKTFFTSLILLISLVVMVVYPFLLKYIEL